MSYFSHHPEAYDEIIQKGVAHWLVWYSGLDEDSCDVFAAFISNLQCDYDKEARATLNWLMDKAQTQINDAERAYWDRMVP